eukprot:Platyproteum_vivax@DN7384_c1_g1_i2.p1
MPSHIHEFAVWTAEDSRNAYEVLGTPRLGPTSVTSSDLLQFVKPSPVAKERKKAKTHECECGKSFVNKGNLNKHKRTHNATKTAKVRMQFVKPSPVAKERKKAKCTFCGIVTRQDHLKSHMNIHSDGPRLTFECPQCGNSFGSKRTLNQHVNFAHKGKDSQTHECECGKSFVNKGNLNKHKRTHNATKTAKVRMAVG